MSANFYAWPPSLDLEPSGKDFPSRLDSFYENPGEPDPSLVRFVDALLVRWPEPEDDDDLDDPVWAAGPLHGEIAGAFLNVAVTWSHSDEVWAFFRATAKAHGLVCFDPQSEKLHRP